MLLNGGGAVTSRRARSRTVWRSHGVCTFVGVRSERGWDDIDSAARHSAVLTRQRTTQWSWTDRRSTGKVRGVLWRVTAVLFAMWNGGRLSVSPGKLSDSCFTHGHRPARKVLCPAWIGPTVHCSYNDSTAGVRYLLVYLFTDSNSQGHEKVFRRDLGRNRVRLKGRDSLGLRSYGSGDCHKLRIDVWSHINRHSVLTSLWCTTVVWRATALKPHQWVQTSFSLFSGVILYILSV